MIEHDGYYYFLRVNSEGVGKFKWNVVKRPVSVDMAKVGNGTKFHKVATPRAQRAMAVAATETPEDEVIASGLTTEEADNYLKLLR